MKTMLVTRSPKLVFVILLVLLFVSIANAQPPELRWGTRLTAGDKQTEINDIVELENGHLLAFGRQYTSGEDWIHATLTLWELDAYGNVLSREAVDPVFAHRSGKICCLSDDSYLLQYSFYTSNESDYDTGNSGVARVLSTGQVDWDHQYKSQFWNDNYSSIRDIESIRSGEYSGHAFMLTSNRNDRFDSERTTYLKRVSPSGGETILRSWDEYPFMTLYPGRTGDEVTLTGDADPNVKVNTPFVQIVNHDGLTVDSIAVPMTVYNSMYTRTTDFTWCEDGGFAFAGYQFPLGGWLTRQNADGSVRWQVAIDSTQEWEFYQLTALAEIPDGFAIARSTEVVDQPNTSHSLAFLNTDGDVVSDLNLSWQGVLFDGMTVAENGDLLVFVQYPIDPSNNYDSKLRANVLRFATGNEEELPEPEISSPLPNTFDIITVYPNPFNSSTVIRLRVLEDQPIRLVVYDILGRPAAILADRPALLPGYHTFRLNAPNLASGTYFLAAEGTAQTDYRRLTILR